MILPTTRIRLSIIAILAVLNFAACAWGQPCHASAYLEKAHEYEKQGFTGNLLALSFYNKYVSATASDALALASRKNCIDSLKAGKFSQPVEPDAATRQEIEHFLDQMEQTWNAHQIDAVARLYSPDYINNDGLNKDEVSDLTADFWKTYPDGNCKSVVKSIWMDGEFAIVSSRDTATGTSAKPMSGVGLSGNLSSVSEGYMFMRRGNGSFLITADIVEREETKVSFGTVNAQFSAPEHAAPGSSFEATVTYASPTHRSAVCSITSQPLQYPQPTPTEVWRRMETDQVTRRMEADSKGRNEVVMATIGKTDALRPKLDGIEILTRRLNVAPTVDIEQARMQARRIN